MYLSCRWQVDMFWKFNKLAAFECKPGSHRKQTLVYNLPHIIQCFYINREQFRTSKSLLLLFFSTPKRRWSDGHDTQFDFPTPLVDFRRIDAQSISLASTGRMSLFCRGRVLVSHLVRSADPHTERLADAIFNHWNGYQGYSRTAGIRGTCLGQHCNGTPKNRGPSQMFVPLNGMGVRGALGLKPPYSATTKKNIFFYLIIVYKVILNVFKHNFSFKNCFFKKCRLNF